MNFNYLIIIQTKKKRKKKKKREIPKVTQREEDLK